VIWLFLFLIFSVIYFCRFPSFTNNGEQCNESTIENYYCSLVIIRSWLFWSCLIPFVVVLLFILFPTLTMGSLRFLGHGGELTICYAPGIQLQDYSDDITAMSRSDKHTTPYLTNKTDRK
jgi:hypothetical protein